MSKKNTLAAGTSPFAHLLGGAAALAGRALGRRAEDDNDDTPNGDDVEDDTSAEDEDNDQPEKGKRGRRARGEGDGDDDADAADDEDDVDADEPDDEKEAKAFRAGRAAERKRCEAIFLAPAAAGRPDLAAQLAFRSKSTSAEAIGLLTAAATPAPRGRSLDDRMGSRTEARPGAGGGNGGGGKPSFGERAAAAAKKAGIVAG